MNSDDYETVEQIVESKLAAALEKIVNALYSGYPIEDAISDEVRDLRIQW
jgi:hypothetical protein